jgi:hypothetical protein
MGILVLQASRTEFKNGSMERGEELLGFKYAHPTSVLV